MSLCSTAQGTQRLKVSNSPRFVVALSWSAPADLFHSRQAIKKYIQANNKLAGTTDAAFTSHMSRALASGKQSGVFEQPKGMYAALFSFQAVRFRLRPFRSEWRIRYRNASVSALFVSITLLTP